MRRLLPSTLASLVLISACADSSGTGPTPPSDPPAPGGPSVPDGVRTTDIVANQGGYDVQLGGTSYAHFQTPQLGGRAPIVDIVDAQEGWKRVSMRWVLDQDVQQDDLNVTFDVALEPDFQWVPHLTPVQGLIVGQHIFRSPAMVFAEGPRTMAILPDLEFVGLQRSKWYMDWDSPNRRAVIGMAEQDRPILVLYRKLENGTQTFLRGDVELGFYVRAWEDTELPRDPFGPISKFYWDRHGGPSFRAGAPDVAPMEQYVTQAHQWLFGNWRDPVWHEFLLDGQRVGGAVNLVDVSQSPSYTGNDPLPLELTIWNQAWFSALRCAAGRFRWSRMTGDGEFLRTALLSKNLAMAAPQANGLFPSVFKVEEWYLRGVTERSFDELWATGEWTGSDRSPKERGIQRDWYHIADMSWTAIQMLRWYRELEADPDMLAYVKRFADRLLTLQDDDGFFPAWLHPVTQRPSQILEDSPETSLSVTMLLDLADLTGEAAYREAALDAMEAVIDGPLPEGRWEDFETYWSNSFIGTLTNLGIRFGRNGVFKQNNLSLFWTADALLRCYEVTNEPRYLAWGERTINELSMWQQVWRPPFIHVPAVGGFGVMNADGEWNDSRQSMFAQTYMDYYRATGKPEYFERGAAALRASWIMMYTPLNPETKVQWEAEHPFLGPVDHGFEMENYGHDGETNNQGLGIGWFSIYTWGSGAATEAFMRCVDTYGHVYVDRRRGHAFGIDGIFADYSVDGVELVDLARRTPTARDIRIVFADGSDRWVTLDGTMFVRF